MIRKPIVAGQFYPGTKMMLEKRIKGFVDEKAQKIEAKGAILPHAGYSYSGEVAVKTVSRIVFKKTFIIVGPNHTGHGKPFSIMSEGKWQTPLGDVEVDSELAKIMLNNCELLQEDSLAHAYEHSIEVQLPILQYFNPDFKFVPIVVFPAKLEIYQEIAKGIVQAIKDLSREDDLIILASSDMTHYESQESAQSKDKQAIEAILKLDEEALLERVRSLDISMCGYAPSVIMLIATKLLGAKEAQLVRYQTSGDSSGDYSAVVGYAGIIIR